MKKVLIVLFAFFVFNLPSLAQDVEAQKADNGHLMKTKANAWLRNMCLRFKKF